VQAVQLDYEKTPKERPVRLAGPAPVIGDPVRVGMSGVDIEGPHQRGGLGPAVKVKATPLRVTPTRRVKSA
jgi:hypothetical protein